jgi:hypothetical protein
VNEGITKLLATPFSAARSPIRARTLMWLQIVKIAALQEFHKKIDSSP